MRMKMTGDEIASIRRWLKRGTGSEAQIRFYLSIALDEIEKLRNEKESKS